MNDFNKNFIKDFADRTSNFHKFDSQMGKIFRLKTELEAATKETVNFLNDSVMATATSSLIQTSVIMPRLDDGYHRDDCDEFVTFNHKGMGTINVVKPDKKNSSYSYGTARSDNVSSTEFLYVVSNDDMRNALISDMINNKKTKLLKHFNDMCAAKDELVALNNISEQYQKDCKGLIANLEEPQELYYVKHDSDDEGYATKLTKFTVTGIQIDDAGTMRLKTTEIVDEEPNYDNGYGKKVGLRLRTSDIETSMVFMQFPVELKKALDDMEKSIQADHDKVTALKHSIEEKLATYSVLKSLM